MWLEIVAAVGLASFFLLPLLGLVVLPELGR